MSYKYEDFKEHTFTDEGQRQLLRMRDHCRSLLASSGAFRMDKAVSCNIASDAWTEMSLVDRLVELGEIYEISDPGAYPAGQNRLFADRGWRP